jgi:RHS repeat-associated protein
LIGTAGYTYIYDNGGQRIRKQTGTNYTEYVYWNGEPIAEKDQSGAWTEYVFFNGQRIARRNSNASVHYYVSDHLGTLGLQVSSAGAIEQESDYYPFGGERVVTGSIANDFKFSGKERDGESGLDEFGARNYASNLGRFIRPDDVLADQDPSEPQSWNLFEYVRNNPILNVDPSGNACVSTDGGKTWSNDKSGGETCEQVEANWKKQKEDNDRQTEALQVMFEMMEQRRHELYQQDGIIDNGLGPLDFVVPGTKGFGFLKGLFSSAARETVATVAEQVIAKGGKAAIRDALESGAVNELQKQAVKRALKRGAVWDMFTIEKLADGSIRITREVAGKTGGRATYETVVNAAGKTVKGSALQLGYDAAGNVVHHDPKN